MAMDSIWEACQRHGYGISASSVIKFTANNSRFARSSATNGMVWAELYHGNPGFTGALGQFRACCKGREKTWIIDNDAPKISQTVESVWNGWFSKPPLNGFMFGASPSPRFDQAVGPALGDLQSDQVEYFSSWSQWVGPQIHPTWVRDGRNKFVLFPFFPPT